MRLFIRMLLGLSVGVLACRQAFADRARCAQDLRDYEDGVRMERDTLRQAKQIAAADSAAVLAGRGPKQRLVIHNLLTYSARSRLAPRGAHSGKIAEFVCSDSAQ